MRLFRGTTVPISQIKFLLSELKMLATSGFNATILFFSCRMNDEKLAIAARRAHAGFWRAKAEVENYNNAENPSAGPGWRATGRQQPQRALVSSPEAIGSLHRH